MSINDGSHQNDINDNSDQNEMEINKLRVTQTENLEPQGSSIIFTYVNQFKKSVFLKCLCCSNKNTTFVALSSKFFDSDLLNLA